MMMNKDDFKFVEKSQTEDLEQTRKSLTYWQDVWRRLRKNKMSMVGLVGVIAVILFGIIGPAFTSFSYQEQDLELVNLSPKLASYKIADGRYLHRTEGYRMLELNEDGEVVDFLDNVDQDHENDVYSYAYELRLVFEGAEEQSLPLPTDYVLDEKEYYSEKWGIALLDRKLESGITEVVISYIHPDSYLLTGEVAEGKAADDLVGAVLFQFRFQDGVDLYTIRSVRRSRNIIDEMENKGGVLKEVQLYTDFVTLDFSLFNTPVEDRPADQKDVEYILTYQGETFTKITDKLSNGTYPWGTDHLGRDVLTRVMYGARISLTVAFVATLVNFLIGITYGSIAGYKGGSVDNYMMRFVDIINSIPLTLYVILLMVVLRDIEIKLFGFTLIDGSDGLTTIIIALGSIYWVGMARLVRGQILGIKEQEYVLAAKTIGVSNFKIITRHLIPNALGPIIVSMTMMIPSAVFTEAFLSFIGIGVSAPQASWGTLANEALGGIEQYPYQLFFPSLAIAFTMLAFNFLGDGLRDALDPRLRKG